MSKILKVNNLKKIYHDKDGEVVALSDISFDVNEKEIIAIVGPSGCGKSTLLSILMNLEKPSSGTFSFKKDTSIGYMLQNDCLFPWKTILENCLVGLEVEKKLTNDSKNYVINLLKTYGLEDFMYKYPSSLSGGMRQRCALIRTLALKPDILLLDEATSALDYQSRLKVSEDIYNIIKNEEKSAIMVTHDISQAISIADRVIVLSNRPAIIKKIYNIKLTNKSTPLNNRKTKEFIKYHDMIWSDLDGK